MLKVLYGAEMEINRAKLYQVKNIFNIYTFSVVIVFLLHANEMEPGLVNLANVIVILFMTKLILHPAVYRYDCYKTVKGLMHLTSS